MLARLNSIVRAIRIGLQRRWRRPAQGEMLFAEGALARVQQVKRAVGIAAVIGVAGWVLLSHPRACTAGAAEARPTAHTVAPLPAFDLPALARRT